MGSGKKKEGLPASIPRIGPLKPERKADLKVVANFLGSEAMNNPELAQDAGLSRETARRLRDDPTYNDLRMMERAGLAAMRMILKEVHAENSGSDGGKKAKKSSRKLGKKDKQ